MPIEPSRHCLEWANDLAESAKKTGSRISGVAIDKKTQEKINNTLTHTLTQSDLKDSQVIGQLSKGHCQRKKMLNILNEREKTNEPLSSDDIEFLKKLKVEIAKKLKHKPLFVFFRTKELKAIELN